MRMSKLNFLASRDQQAVYDMSALAFMKRWFGLLVIAVIVLAGAIVVLIAGFVAVKNQKVDRQYFATENGRVTRIVSISEPYVSDAKLLGWVQQCVTEANTYDFVNYRASFQRSSRCFTDAGWTLFQTLLGTSGNLNTVLKDRLVASAVATGAGVIVNKGVLNGVYTWEIQQPINVYYQGGNANQAAITQKLILTIRVVRVSTDKSEEGIGITQYVGAERS